jgi:hypothetical protein
MKLDHCLIAFNDEILQMKLCPFRKHSVELGEGTGDKVCLAVVVVCEWVRAHDSPVDVISNCLKKAVPSPLSRPLKISRTLSGVISI